MDFIWDSHWQCTICGEYEPCKCDEVRARLEAKRQVRYWEKKRQKRKAQYITRCLKRFKMWWTNEKA